MGKDILHHLSLQPIEAIGCGGVRTAPTSIATTKVGAMGSGMFRQGLLMLIEVPRLADPRTRLLRRRDPLHAPLCQQRAQCGRLDRLVEHLNVVGARLLAHVRAAIGGDQDGREIGGRSGGAALRWLSMPLPSSR